jgi:hypothetical protein
MDPLFIMAIFFSTAFFQTYRLSLWLFPTEAGLFRQPTIVNNVEVSATWMRRFFQKPALPVWVAMKS